MICGNQRVSLQQTECEIKIIVQILSWFIGPSACDLEVNAETALREQEREEVEPVSQ